MFGSHSNLHPYDPHGTEKRPKGTGCRVQPLLNALLSVYMHKSATTRTRSPFCNATCRRNISANGPNTLGT